MATMAGFTSHFAQVCPPSFNKEFAVDRLRHSHHLSCDLFTLLIIQGMIQGLRILWIPGMAVGTADPECPGESVHDMFDRLPVHICRKHMEVPDDVALLTVDR